MKFKKNQTLNVEIVETNMLGFGVVKSEGAVIFVQNGVAGDVCKVKIIKCAKNYCVARIEELIKPSEFRIEPTCKHFRRCGGCSFQHINYDHEKDLKKQSVCGFLRKEGLSDVEVLPVISVGKLENYRNKAQFPVSLDSDGKVICGFYAPKTHNVCALEECKIQNEQFTPIAECVCEFLTKHKIPPYSETEQTGLVRHIYLRIAQATGQIMLCLVLKENHFPWKDAFVEKITSMFSNISSIVLNVQPENNNVILGKHTCVIFGSEKISDVFCDRELMISPLSFYQVNHDAAELLYQTAFSMANLDEFDHIIDLYCGIGSISISTHANCSITGVEIIPDAVKDANENAALNSISNAKYICGDAADAFQLMEQIGSENPLLIVDPPRKGLNRELIDEIADHNLKNVLYISCGPDTFARDLAIFREKGYTISSVQPVDLFPRTSHVETVALLSRQIDVHKMKLNSAPFEMIKSGEKTIELRLFDEKRQQLKVGDKIVFTDTTTGETLNTTVIKLHRFDSFEELYKSLPLLKCGYTTENVDNANSSDMEEYYSVEEQRKHGVVGIELCRPKHFTDETVCLLSKK